MRKPTITPSMEQILRHQSPAQRQQWEQARMSVCPTCKAMPDAPCTMVLVGTHKPMVAAHHADRYHDIVREDTNLIEGKNA